VIVEFTTLTAVFITLVVALAFSNGKTEMKAK